MEKQQSYRSKKLCRDNYGDIWQFQEPGNREITTKFHSQREASPFKVEHPEGSIEDSLN